MKKALELLLIPDDFKGSYVDNNNCPVARCVKRLLKKKRLKDITVNVHTHGVILTKSGRISEYRIAGGFLSEEYRKIKAEYALPQKERKLDYYIELKLWYGHDILNLKII